MHDERQADGFGRTDPRRMPSHFFSGSQHIRYETAVRADSDKQNCSICPRYWYVDAVFPCMRCGAPFTFSAAEQRTWYEEYGFWVDAFPKQCAACRQDIRALQAARREYDRDVAEVLSHGDVARMTRLAEVIDRLYELGGELPSRINENRRRLAQRIDRAQAAAREGRSF